jgi:hypothetical protein
MNSDNTPDANFNVTANFAVEFINADDDTGRGIPTIRGQIAGKLKALDEIEVKEIVIRAVRDQYPVCWSMHVGDLHITRLRRA